MSNNSKEKEGTLERDESYIVRPSLMPKTSSISSTGSNQSSSMGLSAIGFASICGPIPVPTFAEQMLIGPEGKDARRRSSAIRKSSGGMQQDIATMMGTLEETGFSDEEDSDEEDSDEDSDDHDDQGIDRRKEEQKEQDAIPKMKRRSTFTPSQLKLYGVVDKVTEEMFVRTMGVDSDNVGVVTRHESWSDVFGECGGTDADGTLKDPYNLKFESKFAPDEMRCLALVAHNHMKPAMKEFVSTHKEVLRKFRLTGTNTTMTMLKDAFGDDPTVQYGPAFQSGPLGGDAELCALMCLEDLGGCFFFQDPLSAHPHQADIDCLTRLCNVHNILTAHNPCTAHALCFTLKCALEAGRKDKVPSFFISLKSPGVAVYKEQQQRALAHAKKS